MIHHTAEEAALFKIFSTCKHNSLVDLLSPATLSFGHKLIPCISTSYGSKPHYYIQPRYSFDTFFVTPSAIANYSSAIEDLLVKNIIIVITGLPRLVLHTVRTNLTLLTSHFPCLKPFFFIFISDQYNPTLDRKLHHLFSEFPDAHLNIQFVSQNNSEDEENNEFIYCHKSIRHSPSRVRRMFLGLQYAALAIQQLPSDIINSSFCIRLRTDTILLPHVIPILNVLSHSNDKVLLAAHPGNGLLEFSDIFLIAPTHIFLSTFANNLFIDKPNFRHYSAPFLFNPEWLFTNLINRSIESSHVQIDRVFSLYFGVHVCLVRKTFESVIDSNYGIYVYNSLQHGKISVEPIGDYLQSQVLDTNVYPFSKLLMQRIITHNYELSAGAVDKFFM